MGFPYLQKCIVQSILHFLGLPLSSPLSNSSPLFHFFYYHFPAKTAQDFEQPDLEAYTTIDMSTLRYIWRTGMDYVLSMEALMHTTLGLKLGYLPEKDAHYLLSGLSILSTWFVFLNCTPPTPQLAIIPHYIFPLFLLLGSQHVNSIPYMDERSAKLKLEALGHVRVALAGSPLNCFLCFDGGHFWR